MANPFAQYVQPQAPLGGGVFLSDPSKERAQARADEQLRLSQASSDRAAEAAGRSADAANRQADAAINTATNQQYDNVMKLRGAYESMPIVKEYRVGITQLGAALNRPADATGDNALIYDYAKAMDPGSVVRESEMDMAASGASKVDAAAAGFKKQFGIEGGGQLSPEIRAKLKREIATKVAAMNKQYSAQRVRYAKDARAMGIDPANVTGDHDGDVFMPQIKAYQETQGGEKPATSDRQEAVASGPTRRVYDERLESKIDSLISAGKFETANIALRKAGKAPISPAERTSIQQWQAKNPGVAYNASQFGREVPTSLLQRASGSDVGAGVARASNAALGGLVGLAAGSKGQGALDAMAANSPKSALAGDIFGGVLGAFGAEAGAAAALGGRGAAWLAPRLGDAAYGASTGFSQAQEGEGGQGALLGAGAGVLGGFLGDRGARAIGSVYRGVQDPAVQLLRGRGVPMTVGQAVGNGGAVGRSIKGVEDALTSVPGISSIVNARRLEGMEGFNRAAFETAGAPAGIAPTATGADGIGQLRQGVGTAYDNALGGTQIDTNAPAFLGDLQAVIGNANAIPPVNGAREAAATALDARILGGTDPATGLMTGRNFQEAYRGLARTGRERAGGDYGHEIGQVMRQGQDALAGALEAQNPGAFTAFRAANSTNRNTMTLADAVNRAKSAEQELFTPNQLNMADAGATRRLSGPLASAAGDRPFYDLANAGQSVLPSKLPDSGTATRGLVAAGVLGSIGGSGVGGFFGEPGAGAGAGLGATLALAIGGSQPAQRYLTSALLDRPDLAVRIGNAFRDNARFGGIAGTAALTPLAVGQQ